MKYIFLALLWTFYCALHSAMISVTVTDYLKEKLGYRFRYYRLFFNLVALVTLVPVLLFSSSVAGEPLFLWNGWLSMIKYSLFATGVVLFMAGGRHYNGLQFLGIRQIRRGATHNLLTAKARLDTRGILGMVRHPWYTGVLFLLWSRDLHTPALLENIILTAYIIIGTLMEERKLLLEFGDAYRKYQERVSMFFPLKWAQERIARG